MLPQLLIGEGMNAADQRPELPVLDDPFEAELRRAAPEPDPRRLAPSGVVIVEARRHRSLVVGLLAWGELRDGEHATTLAGYGHFSIGMHLCDSCYRG